MQATVEELKRALHAKKKALYPSRQRFTLPLAAREKKPTVLEHNKRLADYDIRGDSVIIFKDLGTQVSVLKAGHMQSDCLTSMILLCLRLAQLHNSLPPVQSFLLGLHLHKKRFAFAQEKVLHAPEGSPPPAALQLPGFLNLYLVNAVSTVFFRRTQHDSLQLLSAYTTAVPESAQSVAPLQRCDFMRQCG